MTTPNIEELIERLRALGRGPCIFWEACDALQVQQELLSSQAKRIAELELDLDVQAGSIEAVQAVNARQAERIKELEAAPQVGYFYKWKDAMHGIAKLMDERDTLREEVEAVRKANLDCVDHYNDAMAEIDTLRTQLAAIAATEPVGYAYANQDFIGSVIGAKGEWAPREIALFTRPMPVQDVMELVEALQEIVDGCYPSATCNKARAALSKYKGVK